MILEHGPRRREKANLSLALAVAIRNDETDAALVLLDAGADSNTQYRMYGDPFVKALERRNKRAVDAMLECDVDFKSEDSYMTGNSPLEVAGAWCDLDVIEDMMRLGANIDAGFQMTGLGAAVKSRNKVLIHRLLALGANPGATPFGADGVTPLRAAVEASDYETARFLISKGASPADDSAFAYAMSQDPVGYEFLLSEFGSRYPQGLKGFGGYLLDKAIELDSRTLIDSLLSVGADLNSWCSLHKFRHVGRYQNTNRNRYRVLNSAIEHSQGRDHELVRKLLDRGAESNCIVNEYGVGPDCIFETPLLLAIKTKSRKLVSLILDHVAEVNRPARRGVKRTPLKAACETGIYSLVELLVRKGARVNGAAAERGGGTALQMAAKTGSLKIVKLLLDNGADPYLPKSKVEGRTAFEAAAQSGCIVASHGNLPVVVV